MPQELLLRYLLLLDILNNVTNGISYYDQDSFLSDVLYEKMNALSEKETDSCMRILVILDGADDNSIGYTNDEVRSYIGENSYQVYTVGIPGKDNSQELEVLFSFSRAEPAFPKVPHCQKFP